VATARFDRTPPQSIDAERSVLGAVLLNPDAIGTAIEILRDKASDVFYVEAHQHIYDAVVTLYRQSAPVDIVTLVNELERTGSLESSGGVSYVADLTGAVPTSANIEYYARIVLDAAILRKIISTCSLLAGEAYNAGVEVNDLLDRAERDIFRIAENRQLNPVTPIGDLVNDAVERIDKQIKEGTGVTGLATGFRELDQMLGGLQKSDVIILAARPSVGKTAFSLNVAAQAAVRNKKNVLIFSLEMSKEQLTQRVLCLEGRINSRRLREGFLASNEFKKVIGVAGKVATAPLYIDDTPNISVLELRSKARRHAAQHGLDLLIIDYLQLMGSTKRAENRQVEIAEISRAIKGLGRELRVPVMALSQLSREAERDDSGAPKLSHLRESGAIEQDADVVLMLSRPRNDELEDNPNLIHLTVAKHRNGPTGQLKVLFEKETQHFGDLVRGPAEVAPAGAAYEYADFDDEEILRDDVPF
jgi:replicative DNA helicase